MTSLRNSLRTNAISLPNSPDETAAGNWGGHQLTWLSVNQPACSNTRRASSTVRCP